MITLDEKEQEHKRNDRSTLSEGSISLISDGLVVTTISIASYVILFAFEAGFANAFSIPLSFIELSLTNVLIVISSLLPLGYILFSLSNILFIFFDNFIGSIAQIIRKYFPLFIFTIALAYLTYGTYLLSIVIRGFILSCMIVFFLEFILPFLTQRGKGNYREKLEAQDKLETQIKTLNSILVRRIGVTPYVLVFVLISVIILAYVAGYTRAAKQTTYLVTSTSPEMVVLRIYGDNIISAPFSRNTREVKPSFVVLKVGDDYTLKLNYEHIGPLKLE